jgi:hypothetical protein
MLNVKNLKSFFLKKTLKSLPIQLNTLTRKGYKGKIYVKILGTIYVKIRSETGFGSETITEYEHIWGFKLRKIKLSLRGIRVKYERARVVK